MSKITIVKEQEKKAIITDGKRYACVWIDRKSGQVFGSDPRKTCMTGPGILCASPIGQKAFEYVASWTSKTHATKRYDGTEVGPSGLTDREMYEGFDLIPN